MQQAFFSKCFPFKNNHWYCFISLNIFTIITTIYFFLVIFCCLVSLAVCKPLQKSIIGLIPTAPWSSRTVTLLTGFVLPVNARGKTRGRADIMRAVLPCGGRKRAFEWWNGARRERLISYQRAVWKWCYLSGLNFNYIWARHWRLNMGLGFCPGQQLTTQ